MNPQSLHQFSVETVFSSPIILQFGVSKIIWTSVSASAFPGASTLSNLPLSSSPGKFGSNSEFHAYQAWASRLNKRAPKTELLANVPLSSIFNIDSVAIIRLCQQIGFNHQSELEIAELRANALLGSKSVDLLAIDRVSGRLLRGMEVDSHYHAPPWQVDLDMIKSHFFLAHKLKLLRIHCSKLSANMTPSAFSSLLGKAQADWMGFAADPTPVTLQPHMPGGHQSKPWGEWIDV